MNAAGGPGSARTAATLGTGTLRSDVELLAQRGRLRLDDQVSTTPWPDEAPSPAAPLA